ncbi:MAG: hypothetical protein WD492_16715 [Alkalispirochaeta sp.]
MQVFIDHISYVLITLLAGVAIGWKTYPTYRRFLDHLHGTDRRAEPIRVRRR